MAMTTVGTEDGIVRTKMGTNTHRNRFLTDISVTGPVNQATMMRLGKQLFATPNAEHRAVQSQKSIFADRKRCHELLG